MWAGDLVVVLGHGLVQGGGGLLPAGVEPVELVHLHQPVGGHDLGGFEVVAHVVEHEHQVVRGPVGQRAEAVVDPFLLPNR